MISLVQSPALEIIIEYPSCPGTEIVANECHSDKGLLETRTKEPGVGVTYLKLICSACLERRVGVTMTLRRPNQGMAILAVRRTTSANAHDSHIATWSFWPGGLKSRRRRMVWAQTKATALHPKN